MEQRNSFINPDKIIDKSFASVYDLYKSEMSLFVKSWFCFG